MDENVALLNKFYSSFSDMNAEGMIACYSNDVNFTDPVFGKLDARETSAMWTMLLSNSGNDLSISYRIIKCDYNGGLVHWTAEYLFGRQKRKVVNKVSAQFTIKNGLITEHYDDFNLWKWSGQALGLPGIILGWTPFFKRSIQKKFKMILSGYINTP